MDTDRLSDLERAEAERGEPAPPAERPPSARRPPRAAFRAAAHWFLTLRGALTLLLAVGGLALAVAGYLGHRARLESQVLRAHALADGDFQAGRFDQAREGFQRALDLIRQLRSKDHFLKGELERKHAEANLMANLLPVSLEELARRAQSAPSPDDWRRTVAAEHRGRTVIFDTTLLAPPGRTDTSPMAVGYEVRPPGGHRLRLDFTGCPLFTGRQWTAGERVIFGATLDGMTYQELPGQDDRWTIRFAPDGYVLVRDERLLTAGGLEVDDDLIDAIRRQRNLARR